jgi:hypothetical protein
MRWAVRIELKEDEAGVSADSGAICIERARLEDAAELGVMLPLTTGPLIVVDQDVARAVNFGRSR